MTDGRASVGRSTSARIAQPRPIRRIGVVVAVAALLAAGLSACTPNRPSAAIDWLTGRAGIVETSILADHSDAFSSSGLIRGELRDDLSADDLARLVDEVQGYLADHDAVAIRLGRDDIDFAVSESDSETATAIDLWETVSGVPGIVNAVTADRYLHARTLRPDAFPVLAAVDQLTADIEVEAFRDEPGLRADTSDDDFFGPGAGLPSFDLVLDFGCSPGTGVREFAESLVGRDEIDGGDFDFCTGFTVHYAPDAAFADAAVAVRGELDAAGLTEFPVTIDQIVSAYAQGHTAVLTPGDPAALPVLAVFEAEGVPELYYTLDADRTLEVTGYDAPTSDLFALLQESPIAATLPLIRLIGSPVSVEGTLDQLTPFIAEATALIGLDPEFVDVQLGADNVVLKLTSPVGTDPDMAAAVTALRSSPIWTTHSVDVNYLNFHVYIVDGIATIGDTYTGAEMMERFVELWNAGTVGGSS